MQELLSTNKYNSRTFLWMPISLFSSYAGHVHKSYSKSFTRSIVRIQSIWIINQESAGATVKRYFYVTWFAMFTSQWVNIWKPIDYEGCSYLKKYFQFEGTVDEKKAKIDTPEEFKPLLKSITKKVLSMHKLKGKLLSVLSIELNWNISDLYSFVRNVKLFLIFY